MDHLETEGRNPASERLDELTALEIARLMNSEDARVVEAVSTQLDGIARAIDVIADRLRAQGRLIYVGAGTSGRLGVLDASECPPTFNTPPELVVGLIAGGQTALTRAVEGAEDHPELGVTDLKAISFHAGDVLVGIATSGRTPYVIGAVEYAKSLGAFTIGIACTSNAELSAVVDLPIVPIVGPEILSGSTRLKAGTATKLVLNALTTGTMVRLGKTYGNLMVDLRATNLKLRARTNRIVRQLTGLDHQQAEELLSRCEGELKTALVSSLAGIEPVEARARLQEVGGQVRKAIPRRVNVDASLRLGVDGGGSHTVALLADDSGIIGRGEAGPSNRNAVGDTFAGLAVETAIDRAFQVANRPRCTVKHLCLGLAGAGREAERMRLRSWALQRQLAEHVHVVTDASLLLAAGTPAGWGLAIVAGTGSIAWGKSDEGREARAGGWGHLLGDEGSGYALAIEALQAVVRAEDGVGEPTELTDRLKSRLQIDDFRDVLPLLHGGTLDRPAIAALASIVLDSMDTDAVARRIVDRQAAALAETALAVAKQLGLHVCPLALAGGLLVSSSGYRERVLSSLRPLLQLAPITLVSEPAVGALNLIRALE